LCATIYNAAAILLTNVDIVFIISGTFGALLVSPFSRGIGAYVEFRYSYSTRRKFVDYVVFQDGFLDNKSQLFFFFCLKQLPM